MCDPSCEIWGHLIKWVLAKNNSGNAYLIFRYMTMERYLNLTVNRVRPKSCSKFCLQSRVFGSFTIGLNGVTHYWCFTYRSRLFFGICCRVSLVYVMWPTLSAWQLKVSSPMVTVVTMVTVWLTMEHLPCSTKGLNQEYNWKCGKTNLHNISILQVTWPGTVTWPPNRTNNKFFLHFFTFFQ